MKVLTIKEPWATLIIEGYKKYEFRSWKTNYRGKILIHAGMSLEKDMLKRFKDYNLNYSKGAIIGEAEIVDCIKVDEKFNQELISIDPIVYSKSNHTETYAWKLENVVKYDNQIYIKGKLGLWNYEDLEIDYKLQLIMDKMNQIQYGFADNEKNIYPDSDENWDNSFSKKYFLQAPESLIESKYGVCWDQVELERYYLEKEKLEFNSYFIINYDDKIFPTHTFIIVNINNNEYIWFEHSWEPYRGIHKFNSLDEALLKIKNNFDTMIKNKYNIDNKDTIIYKYEKPKYNINGSEFFKHCESGSKVLIDN